MAKRFTDTEKWDHEWFMELPADMKLFWFFILDKCDNAGLWKVNKTLANVYLGRRVDLKKALETFKDKFIVLKKDVWFIPKFVEFQYGALNENVKAHKSVIDKLSKFGLINEKTKQLTNSYLTVHRTVHRTDQDKDKDKDKVKYKDKDKNKEKDKDIEQFSFEALYLKYPRKDGKEKGLATCKNKITTKDKYDALSKSIDNYCVLIKKDGTERKYIKHFSTFMNCWEDYLEMKETKDPKSIEEILKNNAINKL